MKAVRFHEVGGPEVLRYEDAEQPVPGAGEVRIRVAASAFNAADNGMRAGFLPIPIVLPHVPSYDVSGTVDALGDGVDGLQVGDAVIGFLPMERDGGAAEYVVTPADRLVAAPTSIPLADAAALPSVSLTAWQALFDHGKLSAGQRVLINGAGGAVGGFAVQLAKEVCAQVIAVTGPRSVARVRSAGAAEVIDHGLADLTTARTAPVDLVVNVAPVSPEQLCALLAMIRDGGKLVSTTTGVPAPSDEKRSVQGIDLFVRSDIDQLADLVARVSTGELLLDVAHRVTLADLPALHAQAGTTALPGMVVVLVVREP